MPKLFITNYIYRLSKWALRRGAVPGFIEVYKDKNNIPFDAGAVYFSICDINYPKIDIIRLNCEVIDALKY